MDISRQIEKLMRERSITRLQLSKDTEIPYTTLTQIINGRTKNPQVKALEKIADYFNVSLDYIMGNSINALIEARLSELNMTFADLSKATELPESFLRGLDTLLPKPWDYEPGQLIDRLAKTLKMDTKILTAAYERQEPPVYERPPLSPEQELKQLQQDFKNEEFETPKWATTKDVRDLKKMLEEDLPVMFDGVPIEGEARQRVMDVLTGLFWEAKEMNKKTYGRKNGKNKTTSDDNTE